MIYNEDLFKGDIGQHTCDVFHSISEGLFILDSLHLVRNVDRSILVIGNQLKAQRENRLHLNLIISSHAIQVKLYALNIPDNVKPIATFRNDSFANEKPTQNGTFPNHHSSIQD